MKRHEIEHLIRAAGAITESTEIIVIGSQSILVYSLMLQTNFCIRGKRT